jgi:hypothetical protein
MKAAMNELIAIVGPKPGPGHGECFIWKRGSDDTVVAVDAGGAGSIGSYAGKQSPETLILSHDDRDHIAGAVNLINAAVASLRELWVPAEWAILIKQIAETNQSSLFPEDSEIVSVDSLAGSIGDQITSTDEDSEEILLSIEILALARENLSSWDVTSSESEQGFSIIEMPNETKRWYGAKNLNEIIRRVRYRAKTLIKILTTALTNSVRIRFFSIDLALSSKSKKWETEGKPGTVTLSNASEAPHSLAVRVPPGLAYTYALTHLTVQNRRALCTLLWSDASTPSGGVAIWSDTDGNWLDHSSPLGFDQVMSTLSASSAPHHASANTAHSRVWTELQLAPDELIMVSAGGQKNQSYHPEYNALKSKRCCTWCRPTLATFQQVRASSTATSGMQLHNACIGKH